MPGRTATAVRLLEEHGWANVGKANLHEFAYGITSQNPHYGTVPNPVAPGRVAGGSSGGSAAAVAAGAAEGALGSDSGGSIRIPAAWCGIVGFKPSYGRVPMEGCFPLAPSFDHAGPLAASVRVCAEMSAAMIDGLDAGPPGELGTLRVGVAWLDEADPLVAARVSEAAQLIGVCEPVEAPFADAVGPAFMREVAESHAEIWPGQRDLYGRNVATKVERCMAVSDAEDVAARRRREELGEALLGLFDRVDLLITPTVGLVAPPANVDELSIRARAIRFTIPFNAIGAPALALPCGPAELGLPASAQLVGRPGDDSLVLAAGELLESRLRHR